MSSGVCGPWGRAPVGVDVWPVRTSGMIGRVSGIRPVYGTTSFKTKCEKLRAANGIAPKVDLRPKYLHTHKHLERILSVEVEYAS